MGLSGKLKRKDIDQVNHDFSNFSLSSPATKIRRLDADLGLPPILEEEECFPENQEKAIVLFNPLLLHNYNYSNNSLLLRSPSTLSISLGSDLISGFKNQLLQATDLKSADFDEAKTEQSKKATEDCLAVVPWVPSQIPSIESRDGELEVPESMEADGMDIEEYSWENARMEQGHGYEFGRLKPGEGLHHHWPQQHCMMPQPPQNPFTPITWSH